MPSWLTMHTALILMPQSMLCLTIWGAIWIGNRNPHGWMVFMCNQLVWAIWIVMTQSWEFLPGHICLWIVYARNYLCWKSHPSWTHTK